MQGACPTCSTPLSIPHSGEYRCERCRRPFEVIVSPTGGVAPTPAVYPTTPAVPTYPAPPGYPYAPSYPTAYGPPYGPVYPGYQASMHTLVVPDLVASPEDPHCALHPLNRAAITCERCGDFICAVCNTPAEGRVYCPRCFDLLADRGAFQWAKEEFVAPRTALALAWVSLPTMFLGCAGLIPATISIITALDVLKQVAERPELPGRQKAIAALCISAASILLLFVGIGVIFWLIASTK